MAVARAFYSRFREYVARPLGGGGGVRCQGSSRAAAGGVRGWGRHRYLAMRPLAWRFSLWRLFKAVVIMLYQILLLATLCAAE